MYRQEYEQFRNVDANDTEQYRYQSLLARHLQKSNIKDKNAIRNKIKSSLLYNCIICIAIRVSIAFKDNTTFNGNNLMKIPN